jgi:hypothetical protein
MLPESVEEAGVLLGATITRCGREHIPSVSPPRGMPSTLASVQPHVPSAELLLRLYDLRSLLPPLPKQQRNDGEAEKDESSSSQPQKQQMPPLVSAPSLLAVLMKLLPVSTSIAARPKTAATTGANTGCSFDTPPMLSVPIRKLWCDCVAQCHSSGQGLTGNAKIDTLQFVRQMSAVALTNPKSARAAGGVRLAALDVISKLFEALPDLLAPWSVEVLQLVLKALKSAGHGEPAYRESAVRAACATAVGCRESQLNRMRRSLQYGNNNNSDDVTNLRRTVLLKGGMDDKAVLEAVKVLKQAVTDRCDSVRALAAHLASLLAPLLIHASSMEAPGGNVWASMDDVVALALKNVDDEAPFVSDRWSDAVSRCISTCIEYNETLKNQARNLQRRNPDAEASSADGTSATVSPTHAASSSSVAATSGDDGGATAMGGSVGSRFGAALRAKAVSPAQSCIGLGPAIQWLVELFLKSGGELSAFKGGGPYSVGGRAVRVGIALCLVKLVQLHAGVFRSIGTTSSSSGSDSGLTYRQLVERVLRMLGDDMEKQLRAPLSTDASSSGGVMASGAGTAAQNLFGGGASLHRVRSKGDPSLVRSACCRILREGLSESVPEPAQLAILHEMIGMIIGSAAAAPSNKAKDAAPSSPAPRSVTPLNANQLQVLLVELSCLVSTLGEAASAAVEDATASVVACWRTRTTGSGTRRRWRAWRWPTSLPLPDAGCCANASRRSSSSTPSSLRRP